MVFTDSSLLTFSPGAWHTPYFLHVSLPEGKIASVYFQLVLEYEQNQHFLSLDIDGYGKYGSNEYDSQVIRFENDTERLYFPGFDRCIAVDLGSFDPNLVKGLRCSDSNPSFKWIINDQGQIINQATATCLTAPKDAPDPFNVYLSACDKDNPRQKFFPFSGDPMSGTIARKKYAAVSCTAVLLYIALCHIT